MAALASWDWSLDGWIVAAGVLSAVAASLLGNFLVLRRLSMLGDAISHAVLPGLAAAFLLTASRQSVPMFLGAVAAGVLTALLTEWIRGSGRVDEGAAMGVVFTSLFALGLVMIVQAADHVDLDPGCVLYGAIELTPLDTTSIGGWNVPRVVVQLAIVLAINLAFVVLFFKELKIAAFDPALATASGLSARAMHYVLMTLVAVTSVASFESVGNILVVAMFVAPAAAAHLLTDRLPTMIVVSAVIAAVSAFAGHVAAIVVPSWFGFGSTSTAGMMAVAAGVLFAAAALFAPRHGVLVRQARHAMLAWKILADDVVALLYRLREQNDAATSVEALHELLLARKASLRVVLAWQQRQGLVVADEGGYRLTERGTGVARLLVRSHRLWEHYLATEAGLPADRIHTQAEQFEHFTDEALRRRLDDETAAPRIDPHGSPIPAEASEEQRE